MVAAAKLIGAGMAAIGVGSGSIGAGLVFAALINGTSRNPSLKGELFSLAVLAFALSEAIALFALMLAFLILFAF